MKAKTVVLSLLIIGLMIAAPLWFFATFKYEPISREGGFRGEARTNPLYATRLLLKRMGLPAERHDRFTLPPDTDTVLIIDSGRYTITEKEQQALLEWVASGGHLITRSRAQKKSLFDWEDIDEDFVRENTDFLQKELEIYPSDHVMVEVDDQPLTLQLPHTDEHLAVEMDFFYSLTADQADFTAAYKEQIWLAQQTYGEGLVTLAANLDFMENSDLDDADHARLVWSLIHSQPSSPRQVWLIHQDSRPSLWALLTTHAQAVLWTFAVLIGALFWAWMPRFGALIAEPPPHRRQLLEHIRASGQFLWKHPEQRDALLQSTRLTIRQLAQKRLTGGQLLDAERFLPALAAYLKWPENNLAQLEHLLVAPQLSEPDFLRLVQIANILRNAV